MDVKLPDGSTIEGVPEGTTKEQLLNKLLQAKHPAAQALLDKVSQENTLKGMSGLDKFNAGAGLAFTNLGRAAKQMVGMDSEYQQNKGADRALTSTGAGLTGNIAGNVAAFAPAAFIPGANTVAGAGVIGGVAGALQPTDTTMERLGNMGTGAALGSGVQALAQYPNQIYEGAKAIVTKPFQAAKAAIEPLYEGGRQKILARALADATGGNRAQTISNLKAAQELVPGSLPTAAEVGESGGLAAMQRAASAVDPEAYTARAAQQNEARGALLNAMTGEGGERAAALAARENASTPLYQQAYEQGIDPAVAQANRPLLQNLQERMPAGVLDKAKELARIEGRTLTDANSLEGLHYVKKAVDDLLDRTNANSGIGSQMERALTVYKKDLLSTMDELSPLYGQGRRAFTAGSRPINQMDIAQAIADKSINKLTGQVQPQAYARALTDDMAARATGFDKATLANTLEPEQLAKLQALKEDLARSVAARDLGRGAGSDTTQKLAMTNLMQRSGLPVGVVNLPGVGRVGNWLYQNADQQMRQELAKTLLDPKKTAALMEGYKPYTPMGAPSQLTRDRAAMLGRMLALPAAAEQ